MSDTEQPSTTEGQAPSKQTSHSSCKQGSCCKPHASLYISIIALALAGYAAFNVTSHDNSAMQTQVDNLNNNLASINQQMETLNQAVQSNRDNLVQNKLKKALENIRDISGIAEEGSKAAISKVESMLQKLTNLGEQLITPAPTPATTEPAAIEIPAVEPKAAPIEPPVDAITAPASEEKAVSEAPVAPAPVEQEVPVDPKAPISQAAPAQATPETSNPTPATNKATEPAVKVIPDSAPSAPQAF